MGKDKRTPKKKRVKDLSANPGAGVRGGRQTAKTDFGSVLGTGISKPADTAISKS